MAQSSNKKIVYTDVEYETVEKDEIVSAVLSAADQARLVKQVETEYQIAYKFLQAKRQSWLARLKLYNNQRRDQDAVGDPLLFTVFNTVHAALYDDRLSSSWEGKGGQGDEDVEENLNALSEHDYYVMEKPELDYEWNWDAEFFGRGLMMMMDFDRSEGFQCPAPEIIDPTVWLRDPRAASVNGTGIRRKGAMRFGGMEVGSSYWELKNHPAYFNVDHLKKNKEIKSLIDEVRQQRRSAQGLENFYQQEEELGKRDNYEFQLLRWFTHWKGKKYLVELGNIRTLVVRIQKLDFKEQWPIIDRALYPIAHDWDGVSIPDLTEDKQRARAVLINLGLKSAKADVMPTYLFDQQRIKNKNDLNFKTNKFIGVDGRVDNAILAVQKPTVHQYVDAIMDILDTAAQRATATPDMQQGITSKKQRTLGELELVSSKVDTRYSMSAKIYGWSERRFWLLWYLLYKKHFKDEIDEKIIRIQGALAPIWRPLNRENIISFIDPDVKIESRILSEAKRMRDLQAFMPFAGLALQDPANNRRYIFKKAGKLQGMQKEEIDIMFPPTVDELQAEEENIMLNAGKLPQASVMDDHATHIFIHAKADQNPQSIAHIRHHKKLMLVKRNRIDLFPPTPEPTFSGAEGTTGMPAKSMPRETSSVPQ